MNRTSKKHFFSFYNNDVTHTFGNLDFETIPDLSWIGGFGYGGSGYKFAFSNLGEQDAGPLALAGSGEITEHNGAGDATILVTYNGISHVCRLTGDAGVDSIAITNLDPVTVAIPASNLMEFELVFGISDITQQGVVLVWSAAMANAIGIGIIGGNWVVLNAGPGWTPCVDLVAPVNNTLHRVHFEYDFVADTTTLTVDGVTSAILGACFGGVPGDLTIMYIGTGLAAGGFPTPGIYNVYFASIDFSEIPDYIAGRSVNDLPTTNGTFSRFLQFSRGSTASAAPRTILQTATISEPVDVRVLMDIWISNTAYQNPTLGLVGLLLNSTFDANINNWVAGGLPGSLAVGTIAQDLIDPYAGAGALRVTTGANSLAVATSEYEACVGGTAYRTQVFVRRESVPPARFRVLVSFYNAAATLIGSPEILRDAVAPNVYTGQILYFYPPANAAFFKIHLYAYGGVGRIVNFDEVYIVTADFPRLEVIDDHLGVPITYRMTPRYTGQGWYLLDLSYVRTSPDTLIQVTGQCDFGFVVVDNLRIE